MIRRRFINLSFKPYNIEDYLTITALENDFSVTVPSDCSYSINGGKWMKIEGGKTIPIMAGDFYCFKKESTSSIGTFKIETACKLGGNAMSMIYGDRAKGETAVYDGAFERLFMSCTGITEISNNFLPATTLADYCYDSMFRGCSSLTQAPELPATTLADYCYFEMFEGCTSLVNAPELPATTLADYCYRDMFYKCTNLSYIKMLATDISASNCLSNWVSGVSSTGTFVKSKDAIWDTTPGALGTSGVPAGWTAITE